jgi:hypothetical protein
MSSAGHRGRGHSGAKSDSKVKEQSLNVIENKGPLWRACQQGGNVVENKSLIRKLRECC